MAERNWQWWYSWRRWLKGLCSTIFMLFIYLVEEHTHFFFFKLEAILFSFDNAFFSHGIGHSVNLIYSSCWFNLNRATSRGHLPTKEFYYSALHSYKQFSIFHIHNRRWACNIIAYIHNESGWQCAHSFHSIESYVFMLIKWLMSQQFYDSSHSSTYVNSSTIFFSSPKF